MTQKRLLSDESAAREPIPLAKGKRGSRRRLPFLPYGAYPLVSVVVFLVAWEALVRVQNIRPIFLPAPSSVGLRVIDMIADGSLVENAIITVARILAGFIIAAVAGVALGLLMGMSRGVAAVLDAFIAAVYPLPKIALIPLLLVWLGSGEAYKIAIAALSAFFPIVLNTYQGVRRVDPGLIQAAANLGADRRQLQMKVIVPGSIPFVLIGFRLGMGVSFILVVAAEMIASPNGLGQLLFYSGQILRIDRVFAVLVVLAFLGWLMTKAQERLDARIAPWARIETRG